MNGTKNQWKEKTSNLKLLDFSCLCANLFNTSRIICKMYHKYLLNLSLMHLIWNPNILIQSWFVSQNFQGGLCSLLWRFSYKSVTSVLESFALPLIIEDIYVCTIGWKSLIRLSLYLISGSNYLPHCCSSSCFCCWWCIFMIISLLIFLNFT